MTMNKTNRTYQVYISNAETSGRIGIGNKAEMTALYNQIKNNPVWDCVILNKWSVRYKCWYEVEKTTRD